MRVSLLALLALLALPLLVLTTAGCAKKSGGSATAAPAADVMGKVNVPKDDNSRSFAGKILSHDITNFTPSGGDGMKFVYKTLSFRNDNTWDADAVLGEGEDSVGCKEHGTWTMEAAKDEHTADMAWVRDHTTCPGRDQSATLRVNVSIAKGEYTISMR